MSYEKVTLPDVSDDEGRLVNMLLEQLHEKTRRNLIRSAYYDGKHAMRQNGGVIPPQYYRLGITLGWSAKAVDLLARRCNPSGFFWPDGDLDALGLPTLTETLHLKARLRSARTSSLLYGPSFLIATQGELGEPDALLHVKDATSATGEWDSRAWRLKNLLSITSRDENGGLTGLVLYLDGETVTAEKVDGNWTVERHQHAYGLPVEAMIYQQREDRVFGSSRISRAVMSIHDQGLRTAIRLEAHNDIYAIPDLWVFGANEAIFKNADGSQKAAWQVMMGRLKAIPDDEDAPIGANPRADIKQIPAASPEPHLASLNAYAKMFAREASLPDTAVSVTDMANPTSGESYDASQHELIAEAEGATEDWSPAVRRTVARLLAIAQGEKSVPEQFASIDVKWRNPRYLTKAAEADAGLKQVQAMPWLAETEVGLELIGLDEQQAVRALAEKRRAQARQALVALTAPTAPQNGAQGAGTTSG